MGSPDTGAGGLRAANGRAVSDTSPTRNHRFSLKPTKSVISKNLLSNTFRKLPLLKNGCPSTPSYPNTNSKKPGASQELTYYITGNGHYGSHSSHVLFSSLSRPRSDPVQGKDGGHFACCFPVGAYTTHPDRPGEWGRHRNRLRAGMPLLTLVLIAGFRWEDSSRSNTPRLNLRR